MARTSQLHLEFPNTWGGRRKGAGRKRRAAQRQVPHRPRPRLASRFPVHITVRLLPGLPSLRGFELARVLRRAFVHGCDKRGFRICHFSIQRSHIHLICEAKSKDRLARGVQGWKVRVARGLNKPWQRKGSVFDDRYHLEVMKTPRQVRNGLCYVLQNGRRHGQRLPACGNGADVFSSACYFDGWRDDRWRKGVPPPVPDPEAPGPPVAAPHTWLLNIGWRRHGLIRIDEVPGPRGQVRTGRRRGRADARGMPHTRASHAR